MPNALIVDDSKTARYVLRQLLIKQQISSDMVESAEEALDYLQKQRPDLIFMDHMMPGMDGFQAVKLIKSNPATQGIPIIMYTSSHGGVYFGQARALGAADVIGKPASARDLQDVLKRLQTQVQRAEASQPGGAAIEVQETTPRTPPAGLAVAAAPATASGEPEDGMSSATLPSGAANDEARALQTDSGPAVTRLAERRRGVRWLVGLAGLGWAAALVLISLHLSALAENRDLLRRLEAALDGLQWALNQAPEYPPGEPPFAHDRLAHLQELLVYLQATGFAGTVRIESHVGEFCLVPAGGSGTLVPARGAMPITGCSALGQSEAEGMRLSQRLAPAFERFLESSPLLRDGRIAVELAPQGSAQPAVPYPDSPTISAESWNGVAQQNNRVVFQLHSR